MSRRWLDLFPSLDPLLQAPATYVWHSTTDEPLDAEKFGSGLTKITQIKTCKSPKHNPPSHLVMEPGVYVWKCEACGEAFQFIVPEITW